MAGDRMHTICADLIPRQVSCLPKTIPDLLRTRAEASPDGVALYYRSDGQWRPILWGDYWRDVQGLAAGLKKHGLEKGDHVGILAPVCLEWELVHMAIMAGGGVLVGLDAHDVPVKLQRIADHAELNVLVLKDRSLLAKLSSRQMSRCKLIIMLDNSDPPSCGVELVSWEDLLHASRAVNGISPSFPAPSDPATIVYTSGSTGDPKGIVYSHEQVVLACESGEALFPRGDGSHMICWLPLSNLYQRVVNFCAMKRGISTYLESDPLRVMDAVREARPDVFIGVPRFYEKLHAGIQASIAMEPWWKQVLIRLAISVGIRQARCLRDKRRPALLLRLLHILSDRLVLRKIRGVMGGRVRYMLSGSAPMPIALLELFHGIGLLILEAYGVSENIVPVAMNLPYDFRFGSVGKPLTINTVKIGPDGLVLVRGPGVFSGYHKDVRADEIADGYYRTGDYGILDADGFLHLKGRASDIIKTSGGRRIAPAGIEARLREVSYVDQVVLLGHGRKCAVAVLTLDWTRLDARLRQSELGLPAADLRSAVIIQGEVSRHVRALLADDLGQTVRTLPRHEQPAGYLVAGRGFSIDGGELTANLKLRRHIIEAKYAVALVALYQDLDRADQGELAADPLVRFA
jgi:long-chain acyl-CoA synthetase